MKEENVVPIILLSVVGIVCVLVGLYFGFKAWGSPLWLYCPGLIGIGSPMLISALLIRGDT